MSLWQDFLFAEVWWEVATKLKKVHETLQDVFYVQNHLKDIHKPVKYNEGSNSGSYLQRCYQRHDSYIQYQSLLIKYEVQLEELRNSAVFSQEKEDVLLAKFELSLASVMEKSVYKMATDYRWYAEWGLSWGDYQKQCEDAKLKFVTNMKLVRTNLELAEARLQLSDNVKKKISVSDVEITMVPS